MLFREEAGRLRQHPYLDYYSQGTKGGEEGRQACASIFIEHSDPHHPQ